MQQGSEQWLQFRKDKIGASDAPIIMGVSPWNNIQGLWEEKVGLKTLPESNQYQQRGLNLEDAARQYFYLMTGYEVKPAVYKSSTYEWMIASVDGISADENILLEIKCPGQKDHCLALNDQIPEKYYPQLQHQLEVLNLDNGYYLSFDGEYGKIIPFKRDQDYIERLIEKELEFYHCIQTFTPPNTFSNIEDSRWEQAALSLKLVQEKQKELELQESLLKNTLIGLSNGQNVDSHGVKLTKCIRKGCVDYNKLMQELAVDIDLEKYRREDSESWKITVT